MDLDFTEKINSDSLIQAYGRTRWIDGFYPHLMTLNAFR